jgi:GntR family transcriptional regulator of arabinose operon
LIQIVYQLNSRFFALFVTMCLFFHTGPLYNAGMPQPTDNPKLPSRGRDAESTAPSSRPYHVVSERLRTYLNDGSLSPGTKIPPLRELASRFSVSTSTVRNAIRVLEREGRLHHIHAVGTFVRPAHTVQVATDQIMAALVVTDLGKPFAVEVVRGVEQACQARRWRLQIYDSRLDPHLELDNLKRLQDSGSQGAILFPSCHEDTIEAIFKLKLDGFPIVLVDRDVRGLQVDTVQSDHESGAYSAVTRLVRAGHERIYMHAGGGPPPSSVEARIRGYERALRENGIEPLRKWFIWSDPVTSQDLAEGRRGRWRHAYKATLQKLSSGELPTAIFAANADTGVGTLHACQEMGLRIPADMSMVCFDDAEITEAMLPPLTYVAQRSLELGRKAIDLLERRLQSPGGDAQRLIVDVELVERRSIAPPKVMVST